MTDMIAIGFIARFWGTTDQTSWRPAQLLGERGSKDDKMRSERSGEFMAAIF